MSKPDPMVSIALSLKAIANMMFIKLSKEERAELKKLNQAVAARQTAAKKQ